MTTSDSIQKRQAVIDWLFPGDRLGEHKFNAVTGKCDQCSEQFINWVTEQPDGTYRAGMRLCPVIGADEVARFRHE